MDLDRDETEQDKLEYCVSQNQNSKKESKNSKTEYDQSKGQSVDAISQGLLDYRPDAYQKIFILKISFNLSLI